MRAIYVSIEKFGDFDLQTMERLGIAVQRQAWRIKLGKAKSCDFIVPVDSGFPAGAWRLAGAYATDEPWGSGGQYSRRRRTGLLIGEMLPLRDEFIDHAPESMRNGCAVIEFEYCGREEKKVWLAERGIVQPAGLSYTERLDWFNAQGPKS